MIITSGDDRNTLFAIDNLQSKLLVEILRLTTASQLAEAASKVQAVGFPVWALDAEAARLTFCAVMGQRMDMMVRTLPRNEQPVTATPEPVEDGGELAPVFKPVVN